MPPRTKTRVRRIPGQLRRTHRSDIGIAGAWFERPLANGESLAGTAVGHDVGPACFGIANNPSPSWSWHRYGCPSADCG